MYSSHRRRVGVAIVVMVVLLLFATLGEACVAGPPPSVPSPASPPPQAPGASSSPGPSSPALYAVVFGQKGLPQGTWWATVLNGTSLSTEGVDSEIVFSEPNGTYDFTTGASGFAANPPSGMVTVAGGPVFVNVAFFVPGSVFQVVFRETGLPPGSTWSANLNGTDAWSTTSSITFNVTNGSYPYGISTGVSYQLISSTPGSPITVNGADVSVRVVFSTAYTVTFRERGMPPAAGGGVSFHGGGMTAFGSGGTVAFAGLANGTYAYSVTAGPGYRLVSTVPPSPVRVNGSSVVVTVQFEAVYPVSFTEAGLPLATPWSVILNGSSQNSEATTVVFGEVPNGTYTFHTATPSTSWQTTREVGTVAVAGSAMTVSIRFDYAYPAKFEAAGLPAGVQWYVNLTANLSGPASPRMPVTGTAPVVYSFASTVSVLEFSLPNGTYTYTVSSSSQAWTPPPTNASFTVDGASPPAQSIVPLQLLPGPSSGLGSLTTWVVVTLLVAGVIALGSMGYRAYALRPAPSEGPDSIDELYASYDLPSELDPAASDDTPDALDDVF